MAEITAEQALFLLNGVYVGAIKRESVATKAVIEAVPADKEIGRAHV